MGGGQRRLGVGVDVVDQADLLGARRVDVLARQRQFAQVPVGQDERQPGQAADVGDDRELDLAHRELRVGAGVADVDRGDQVDAAADAPAVHRGDRSGVRQSATAVMDCCIDFSRVWKSARGLASAPSASIGDERVAHRGQVESVAEVAARSGQDDRPDVGVGVQLGEDHRQLGPERRTHRVALARADQRHLRDVVVDVDGEGFVWLPMDRRLAARLRRRAADQDLADRAVGRNWQAASARICATFAVGSERDVLLGEDLLDHRDPGGLVEVGVLLAGHVQGVRRGRNFGTLVLRVGSGMFGIRDVRQAGDARRRRRSSAPTSAGGPGWVVIATVPVRGALAGGDAGRARPRPTIRLAAAHANVRLHPGHDMRLDPFEVEVQVAWRAGVCPARPCRS